ncbi:MAG: fibronectin type III domain-containing protein, partial [Bacteroidetes bacterium SB0662_bin_6]|nr:fibronectin type III domain-containing protein [Bacteroidetes bacterium SB0662_bin_6]
MTQEPLKERALSRPGAARLVAIAALFSAMVVVTKGAQAQTSTVLVSNIEQESYGFTLLSLIDAAQGFTTGNSSATLKSIDVKFSGAPNSTVSVKLATGLPGGTTEVATLTNPSSFSSGNLRFTAPDNTTLSANTQYWVVVSAENAHAGNSWITTSASDAEDPGGRTGWSMADDRYWRTVGSTTWVNTTLFGRTGDNVFMIRVNGPADTQPPPNPTPLTTPTTPATPATPGTISHSPQYLKATPGDSKVTLTWDAPFHDGGSEITGYAYRLKENGEAFGVEDLAAWLDIPGGASTYGYTVTGLTNGTEYKFELRA